MWPRGSLSSAFMVLSSRNFIHLVACLSVVQSSTYVLLLSIGYRTGAKAPIFDTIHPGTPGVDPVVDALTLTDVVVGATVTALLLALAVQVHKRTGSLDPEDLVLDRCGTDVNPLAPLPVALPLLTAAVILALRPVLKRRVQDLLSLATSAAVAVVCGILMRQSADGMVVYWFGGWTPRAGVALGVSFTITCSAQGWRCSQRCW